MLTAEERIKLSDAEQIICGFCKKRFKCNSCNVKKLMEKTIEDIRYFIGDIEWDTDEFTKSKLPKELIVPSNVDVLDDEAVNDFIGEYTGFCHFGFILEKLPDIVTREGDNVFFKKDNILVSLVNIGEGRNGNFNPEDPEDDNLLRLDVYTKVEDDKWEIIEDSSVCMNISARTPVGVLEGILEMIWNEFKELSEAGMSIKNVVGQISLNYWTCWKDYC